MVVRNIIWEKTSAQHEPMTENEANDAGMKKKDIKANDGADGNTTT